MEKEDLANTHSKFSPDRLHSPPPRHLTEEQIESSGLNTPNNTMSFQDGGPNHVQFAPCSPSIIPSPFYDESSIMDNYSQVSPISPSIQLHTLSSQATHVSPVSDSTPSSSHTLTSESRNYPINASIPIEEKTMVEDYGPRFNEEDEERANHYALMDQPSYERTPDASNVFLQLETVPTDHELPAYKPYTQPPAFSTHQRSVEAPGPSRPSHSPYGSNRGPLMRALVGPVRRPWFSWLTGLAMFIVLIYELIKSNMLAGYFIETNPFNIMVGPGFSVLVNLGAKFTPCIRPLPNFTSTTPFSDCFRPNASCTLEELCAFGGFANGVANQSFRFIIPIFLHAGIVHYVINMLTHLRLGADLERALGVPRYMVLYLASGIWGVILSSILSQSMSASMGCSGALFGLIGYMFVDVIVNWKIIPNPVKELMKLFVSTIISLALGLLPGLDNFAHMGGFAVGLVMGILIAPMRTAASKRTKIITWIARGCALVLLVVMFFISINAFYSSQDPSKICPNCKYLSCLPIRNWCDL